MFAVATQSGSLSALCMLALIYLGLAITVGDLLCRRFYRFVSVPHRCAAATLVGVLLSTWFTYLAGLASARTAEPLLWADLLFFVVAPAAIFWLSRKSPKVQMIELARFRADSLRLDHARRSFYRGVRSVDGNALC